MKVKDFLNYEYKGEKYDGIAVITEHTENENNILYINPDNEPIPKELYEREVYEVDVVKGNSQFAVKELALRC